MNAPPGAQAQPPSLQFAFGTEFFKYLAIGRKDWDYATYDLSNWSKDTTEVAKYLNAVDADLSQFKARQGKLILAHGWADPASNPLSTIAYYDQLQARDPRLRDYVRLFMMPGVLHCGGGAGPDFRGLVHAHCGMRGTWSRSRSRGRAKARHGRPCPECAPAVPIPTAGGGRWERKRHRSGQFRLPTR